MPHKAFKEAPPKTGGSDCLLRGWVVPQTTRTGVHPYLWFQLSVRGSGIELIWIREYAYFSRVIGGGEPLCLVNWHKIDDVQKLKLFFGNFSTFSLYCEMIKKNHCTNPKQLLKII